MNDIDYDELDKAMNQLMNGGPGDSPSPSTQNDTPASTAPSVPVSTPVQLAPATRPTPSLAQRRGGRSMDIVSPSRGAARTDVKPISNLMDKPQAPVRDGSAQPARPVVSPVNFNNSRPVRPISDFRVKPNKEPALPGPKFGYEIEPKNDEVKPAMPAGEVAPMAPTQSGDDNLNLDKIASDLNNTLGLKPEEFEKPKDTVESPFLPDAKVEKRPLGAFSSAQQQNVESEVKADDTSASSQTLPAELQSDILSVESSSVAHAAEKPNTEAEQPAKSFKDRFMSHKEEAKTTTPANIPSTFADKASDQKEAALYDDANTVNNALLKKSSKKKGGVLKVVLWALLLVILGVGAGAAVYFLLLPNL